MLEVLQVAAPWLIIWGGITVFFATLKIISKIFKLKGLDESIKF